MLLDLSQLHGAAKHYERRFEPSAFDPEDEDYRVAAPVELVMDVEKAGGDAFRVTGHVTAKLALECSRCLEDFELPIDSRFELRYVPAVDAAELLLLPFLVANVIVALLWFWMLDYQIGIVNETAAAWRERISARAGWEGARRRGSGSR